MEFEIVRARPKFTLQAHYMRITLITKYSDKKLCNEILEPKQKRSIITATKEVITNEDSNGTTTQKDTKGRQKRRRQKMLTSGGIAPPTYTGRG